MEAVSYLDTRTSYIIEFDKANAKQSAGYGGSISVGNLRSDLPEIAKNNCGMSKRLEEERNMVVEC